MSPIAHLVGSWLVASVATNNPRDRKLVTLAGVLPDADGLGVIADLVSAFVSGKECAYYYYQTYHHLLLHGWPGAVTVSLVLTAFAKNRWRVLLLCLFTFHLHLLCDLLGSHGPSAGDIWPICYSEPLFRHPMWFWKYQWRLDGWQNQTIFAVIFVAALWRASCKGYSFVEVISQRADAVFVSVLRGWRARLKSERKEVAG